MTSTNTSRDQCWDRAVNAFGMASIFKPRLYSIRRKIRLLNFFGIAVPVAVGGIVVSFFGTANAKSILSILILIAGVLGTLQLVITIWSLIAKWDDEASYASAALVANNRLALKFSELASQYPPDFNTRYNLLVVEDNYQHETDLQRGINEEEQRKGYRAGLLQYKRKCGTCGEVPKDMQPTKCQSCGNF